MSLDPNDGRRPSIQVAEAIKRSITTGVYAPGEQIPSVPDLAVKYGVAKQTANNALKLLSDEGYIVSRVGSGTFVRTDIDQMKQQPSLGDLTQAMEEVRDELRQVSEAEQPGSPEEFRQLRDEVKRLRKDVTMLQTQLIDLYARTGNQYPQTSDRAGAKAEDEKLKKSQRAS